MKRTRKNNLRARILELLAKEKAALPATDIAERLRCSRSGAIAMLGKLVDTAQIRIVDTPSPSGARCFEFVSSTPEAYQPAPAPSAGLRARPRKAHAARHSEVQEGQERVAEATLARIAANTGSGEYFAQWIEQLHTLTSERKAHEQRIQAIETEQRALVRSLAVAEANTVNPGPRPNADDKAHMQRNMEIAEAETHPAFLLDSPKNGAADRTVE